MSDDYTALLDILRAKPPKGGYRFEPTQFPAPLADEIRFDGLLLDPFRQRSLGFAGAAGDDGEPPFEIMLGYPVVDWYGPRESWQRLGLWLLHVLFSGRSWAGLHLTHPRNVLTRLYVRCERMEHSRSYDLKVEAPLRYSAYIHRPQAINRHPFGYAGRETEEVDFPGFYFGWSDQQASSQRRRAEADQFIMTTTPEGLCALASLFLDFGRSDNIRDEIDLEAPVLAHGSAEVRFWLPGSFAFPEESLDDVYLNPPDDRTV